MDRNLILSPIVRPQSYLLPQLQDTQRPLLACVGTPFTFINMYTLMIQNKATEHLNPFLKNVIMVAQACNPSS